MFLGRPEYAPLLQRLRRRLELGRPLRGKLILSNPTAAERDAIESLLGRRPQGGANISVDLNQLEEQLRIAGHTNSLHEAVEQVFGPIENQTAIRQTEGATWNSLFAEAEQRWTTALPPEWLRSLRADGTLKRFASSPEQARHWLQNLVRLSENLPAAGEPLPSLAARLFSDSHALDPGQPLGTLAQRLAKYCGPAPDIDPTEDRRSIWASVGVLCDELSAPVLAFNLPSSCAHFVGELLRSGLYSGEPIHLSLRMLLRYPLHGDSALKGTRIFVCENPTIVALAAARLGTECRPLVCINGQAATPAQTLLRQLARAGCELYYHGDFDWPGITIARLIFERFHARPWRFSASDYAQAPKGIHLKGKPVETPWDPDLSKSMEAENGSVHEESVADTLIQDLQPSG